MNFCQLTPKVGVLIHLNCQHKNNGSILERKRLAEECLQEVYTFIKTKSDLYWVMKEGDDVSFGDKRALRSAVAKPMTLREKVISQSYGETTAKSISKYVYVIVLADKFWCIHLTL